MLCPPSRIVKYGPSYINELLATVGGAISPNITIVMLYDSADFIIQIS
jgi:hypothetical protein